MSKETTVLALGVLVIITPYLGVPSAWRTALLVLAGLGLLVIGYLLRTEAIERGEGTMPHQPFVESKGPAQTPPPPAAQTSPEPHQLGNEGMSSLS